MTLVDVMREALGPGPCEYVLDIEGLNKTRSHWSGRHGQAHRLGHLLGTRRAGASTTLASGPKRPRRHDDLISTDAALESVEKIKDFLDAAHARIQEYLAWSDEIIRLAEEPARSDPATREPGRARHRPGRTRCGPCGSA